MPHYPHGKKIFFPLSNLNCPSFSLNPLLLSCCNRMSLTDLDTALETPEVPNIFSFSARNSSHFYPLLFCTLCKRYNSSCHCFQRLGITYSRWDKNFFEPHGSTNTSAKWNWNFHAGLAMHLKSQAPIGADP